MNFQEAYRRIDKRFLWNEMLLQPFLTVGDDSVHSFVLPVIHGAIFIHKCIMRVRVLVAGLTNDLTLYVYSKSSRMYARQVLERVIKYNLDWS